MSSHSPFAQTILQNSNLLTFLNPTIKAGAGDVRESLKDGRYFLGVAHLNRAKIESNLSVPVSQVCYENALINSFKTSLQTVGQSLSSLADFSLMAAQLSF